MKKLRLSKTEVGHIYHGNLTSFMKPLGDSSIIPRKLNGDHRIGSIEYYEDEILAYTYWKADNGETSSRAIKSPYRLNTVYSISTKEMFKSPFRNDYPEFIEVKITSALIIQIDNTFYWQYHFVKQSKAS